MGLEGALGNWGSLYLDMMMTTIGSLVRGVDMYVSALRASSFFFFFFLFGYSLLCKFFDITFSKILFHSLSLGFRCRRLGCWGLGLGQGACWFGL
jgi:hypothetical protein